MQPTEKTGDPARGGNPCMLLSGRGWMQSNSSIGPTVHISGAFSPSCLLAWIDACQLSPESGPRANHRARSHVLTVRDVHPGECGLVQSRVTLSRRDVVGLMSGKPGVRETYDQDGAGLPRGKCYPGSLRVEPGPISGRKRGVLEMVFSDDRAQPSQGQATRGEKLVGRSHCATATSGDHHQRMRRGALTGGKAELG
jgi:hypothetical protein